MINIRYIPEGAETRLWQYLGLPHKERNPDTGARQLVAPRMERFCDWWREMRQTGMLPLDVHPKPTKFIKAELLKGGYYNQNPHTRQIEGTMVCHPTLIETLPLPFGATPIRLADEPIPMPPAGEAFTESNTTLPDLSQDITQGVT